MKLEKHVHRREKGQRATIGIRIKNILSHVLCSTLNISDLGFTKFTIIIFISARWGRGKAGMGLDKVGIKILNPSLPHLGVWGENIAPSLPRPGMWGGKNPRGGRAGRVKTGRSKIAIPRL